MSWFVMKQKGATQSEAGKQAEYWSLLLGTGAERKLK